MLIGPLGRRDHRAGRSVSDAAGVSGRHKAVLLEVRPEPTQGLEGGIRTDVLIVGEFGVPLAGLERDRRDLRLEASGVPSGLGPLLADQGDPVDFFARYVVAVRQLLRSLGHGQIAIRVAERFPEQILEGATGRPESEAAPPGSTQHVRRLAHGLCATTECHVGTTQQNLFGTLDDGLEPGSAQPVDREGRLLLGDARAEGNVAGQIDGVRRGL